MRRRIFLFAWVGLLLWTIGAGGDQALGAEAGSGLRPNPSGAPTPGPDDVVIDGRFLYSDARIRTFQVPGNGFLLNTEGEADIVDRSTTGFIWISAAGGDSDVYLVAPVYLPAGSSVQGVLCEIYDNDVDDDVTLTFRLRMRVIDSTIVNTFGPATETTSGSSTTMVRVPHPLVSPLEVVTGDYLWLEVRWQPEAAGSDLRFYGCSVFHEVWRPD